MKCALVIGGKVFVAWKRKMLHDVSGGHQAYTRRKIYVWGIEFCSWLKLVHRPVRAIRVTRGDLEPSAIVLGKFSRQALQVTSHPKSPRTNGNEAAKVSNSGFFPSPYVVVHLTIVGEGVWVI